MSILKFAEFFHKLASSGGFRTLYHISKHGPAKPRPKSMPVDRDYFGPGEPEYQEALARGDISEKDKIYEKRINKPIEMAWSRPWLEKPVKSGVFLTSNPMGVWHDHGKQGTVHVYDVAESVIKESGGLHRYDRASEVLIPEHIWNDAIISGNIVYKGSVPEKKLDKMLEIKNLVNQNPMSWFFDSKSDLEIQTAKLVNAIKDRVSKLRLNDKISLYNAREISLALEYVISTSKDKQTDELKIRKEIAGVEKLIEQSIAGGGSNNAFLNIEDNL